MSLLYGTHHIRSIEHAAAAMLPEGALMQRAGRAAATTALTLLTAGLRSGQTLAAAQVLILTGPGNNGGDALEVAAHLADAGVRVTVLLGQPTGASIPVLLDQPTGQPSPERAAALQRAQHSAAVLIDDLSGVALPPRDWQLVIDGLFGIGLARPLTGQLRELVEQVNALACPVLALDVPSGLDADTGAIVGADGVAIRASQTVTFIGDKPGLHTNQGRDYAGLVEVADLGLDLQLIQDQAGLPATLIRLNQVALFGEHLQARRHSSHKGSYGNVAVIGGARGMSGAPILAARTALHAGAGRVYVLYPEHALEADSGQPELMCRLAEGYDLDQATLVIGPGLGASAKAIDLLTRAIASDSALLVDADALNLLARDPDLQAALARRPHRAVLTPHPLEAARLLATDVASVQADRLAAARTLAARLQAVVVLKGSGTVIAAPDGQCVINPTGNPALATAGTGDVLSGLCGSLLAQGWQPWPAALAAVWLHGAAADDLVASGIGPIGMTAGELLPAIRAGINRLAR